MRAENWTIPFYFSQIKSKFKENIWVGPERMCLRSSSRYRADSVVSWLLVAWENTDVLPSNRWAWNGPVSDSTSMCFKHQQNAILHCMDLAFWASAQSIFTLEKCGKAPKTCLSEGKVIHRFCRGEEIDNTLDLNPVIEVHKKAICLLYHSICNSN